VNRKVALFKDRKTGQGEAAVKVFLIFLAITTKENP